MIIDAHTHMPSEGWQGNGGPFATVAKAVAYLKKTGTDAAIFNTWRGVYAETEEALNAENEAALALAKRYEGFLYPGAVIHPSFPDASRRCLTRFRDEGFLWVGELVLEKKPCRYAEEPFMALFDECARHGHILQLHVHEDIIAVARRFPRMPVVCSHIADDLCPRLAAEPNVWLDISGSNGGLCIGAIERAREAFGPDRLLYGTDFTGYEPRCFMARLKAAVPDSKERDQIFSGNVIRLLKQAGAKAMGGR